MFPRRIPDKGKFTHNLVVCPGPNHIYLWKLDFFLVLKENKQKIGTEIDYEFKSPDNSWAMTWYGHSHMTTFQLCFLVNKAEDFSPTSAEIVVINKNSSENIQVQDTLVTTPQHMEGDKLLYTVLSRVDRNLLKIISSNPSTWLENYMLTISVKAHQSVATKIKHPLIPELLSYLENGKFSDIVLEVDGKEFKAHKIILSLKSPVFSAMFDHESMKESRDNRVVIEDIDADVVQQMLEYIYTEKTPSKIDDCVHGLINAATKYQIDNLKKLCENNLIKNLAVDNAVDTLIVADRYDAKALKSIIIQFITKNVSIFDSHDFKDLEFNNANLAIEILRELIPRESNYENNIRSHHIYRNMNELLLKRNSIQ